MCYDEIKQIFIDTKLNKLIYLIDNDTNNNECWIIKYI